MNQIWLLSKRSLDYFQAVVDVSQLGVDDLGVLRKGLKGVLRRIWHGLRFLGGSADAPRIYADRHAVGRSERLESCKTAESFFEPSARGY